MVYWMVRNDNKFLHRCDSLFAKDSSFAHAPLHDRNDIDCDVRLLVSDRSCDLRLLQRYDD